MLENEKESTPGCSHTRTVRRAITTTYFKREFLAEVDECKDCGAQLWTADTQTRFQQWVLRLRHDKRDVFQVQFYMTAAGRDAMRDLLRRFPGVPMSVLIRGLTAVYLTSLIRFQDFDGIAREVMDRNSYRLLAVGVRHKTSVHFSPIALLDIQAWAQILKMSPQKVVEGSIFRLLALSHETDVKLRSFWQKNILPQLELILRSL